MILQILDTASFDQWRDIVNELAQQVGDLDSLQTTDKTSIVAAINDLKNGGLTSIVNMETAVFAMVSST